MKYAFYIVIIAVLVLIFLQVKSCGDNKGLQLSLDQSRAKDSVLNARQDSLMDANTWLLTDNAVRSQEYNHQIDSLNDIINDGKNNLSFLGQRVQNLIGTIRAYGNQTKDTTVTGQADSLAALYAGAKDNVIYLLGQYDKKDSTYIGEVRYKDSVIAALSGQVLALNKNYADSQAIITGLQTALDKAIKSGKRKNILRSIAEAILLAALIIKK